MGSVEDNIKARYAAEVIATLADEEAKTHGFRFWQELAKIVNSHVPDPFQRSGVRVDPMTDEEARSWGRKTSMPYGEYKGVMVDEVPLTRLDWYAEQTFQRDLKRYLASGRAKRESTDD